MPFPFIEISLIRSHSQSISPQCHSELAKTYLKLASAKFWYRWGKGFRFPAASLLLFWGMYNVWSRGGFQDRRGVWVPKAAGFVPQNTMLTIILPISVDFASSAGHPTMDIIQGPPKAPHKDQSPELDFIPVGQSAP